MKVEKKRLPKIERFEELKDGEPFFYGGELFIKLDSDYEDLMYDDERVTAVSLETGAIAYFKDTDRITPIKDYKFVAEYY